MTTAIALLMAAMSLLTTVSHSPNISELLRAQAIQVADTAISFAQSQLEQPSATITPTVAPQTFVTGSTLITNTPIMDNTLTASILVNEESEVTIPSDSNVMISWTSSGANQCGIDMTNPDGTGGDGGWSGNFGMNGSKEAGPFKNPQTIITLTCIGLSGNLVTSTATINVK